MFFSEVVGGGASDRQTVSQEASQALELMVTQIALVWFTGLIMIHIIQLVNVNVS